ncbi:MAG: tetratricopeptide repeat protein, partial [Acidobacteriia bacterium]|nr:tetratricopeptide repeat protein [Terriglobia bacterium]
RAIEMAGRAGLNEIQAFYLAGQAEEEALVGYLPAAGQAAARSLKLTRGRSTGPAAARALAVAGSPAPAHALAEELAKRYPEDTLLKNAEIPTVEAAVEIDRGNPRRAVELLESAVYEFGSAACPAVYLRGVAQLRAGAANEAVVAFQKVIDHRGIFTNVTFPLAYLGLGRAQALGGKTAEARQAYQEFFALWENADPGVPVLKEARREFARLKPDAPGSGR